MDSHLEQWLDVWRWLFLLRIWYQYQKLTLYKSHVLCFFAEGILYIYTELNFTIIIFIQVAPGHQEKSATFNQGGLDVRMPYGDNATPNSNLQPVNNQIPITTTTTSASKQRITSPVTETKTMEGQAVVGLTRSNVASPGSGSEPFLKNVTMTAGALAAQKAKESASNTSDASRPGSAAGRDGMSRADRRRRFR